MRLIIVCLTSKQIKNRRPATKHMLHGWIQRGSPPGMAQTSHPGKMIYKWRPVTLLKQTEKAYISLNVERGCISVIVDTPSKSWTTLEKSPGTAPALPSTVEEEYHIYKQIWEILFHWNSFFVRPCKFLWGNDNFHSSASYQYIRGYTLFPGPVLIRSLCATFFKFLW